MIDPSTTIYHKNIYGIFGIIGSGKTHVSKLIETRRNFHRISSDDIFKEWIKDSTYLKNLSDFLLELDVDPLTNGVYDSARMFETMFSNKEMDDNWPLVKAINKFNFTYLYSDIVKILKDIPLDDNIIIEMATLPSSAISTICKQLFLIARPIYPVDILKRDPNRNLQIVSNLIAYQLERTECVSEIICNIDQKDLDTCAPYIGYASDEKILEDFDNLLI